MTQNPNIHQAVAMIDVGFAEVSRAVAAGSLPTSALDELKVSWAALVQILELGAIPQMRGCPRCRRTVRRDATRCGHCWILLPPDVTQA